VAAPPPTASTTLGTGGGLGRVGAAAVRASDTREAVSTEDIKSGVNWGGHGFCDDEK
jgi:hypothetical protein